jgi:hypothetical protein
MASELKSTGDKRDWRTVDLYSKSLPEDVDIKHISLATGTVKIEVQFFFFISLGRGLLPMTCVVVYETLFGMRRVLYLLK